MIDWIKIFLNEQELCAINGGITTKYFKLEKNVQQGNLMSLYLFKLCLEILMLRKKTKILMVLKYLRKFFFMLPMQMIVLSF